MASHFGPIKDAAAVLYQANSVELLDDPMLIEMPAKKPHLTFAVLAAVGLVLAGCAGDEGFKGVAEAAGMATTPQQSKAFVRETRPAEVQYIPVGSSVTRTAPRKPVDDYKKIESELEAKQKANEAAGETAKSLGATPPPEPAKVQPQN
ncbi:Beta-barrel assembly machine subunit BamF OS=Bosea thiooxidans OX=53254 GN=SAMN05660750_03772 PE=4 SV=1 [Bosea thiooxidans]|uniref:Uncharacterized protein n=2 Tax=Bosea thiooxidans TaxID=53254 RepID=A0A1T5G549_9HYPH|nr:hypothetical protein SAMN05660750_03772 [Bosea thiooxidans]